jgi:50S ribosomal protein L16 3-hydroxylase
MNFSASDTPSFLGQLTIAQFLKQYWQKKPLLVRQAFNPEDYPISGEEVLQFACDAKVESRLVLQQRQRWQMSHGPFGDVVRDGEAVDNPLPPLKQKNWTVLVQGLNLHHAVADSLLMI